MDRETEQKVYAVVAAVAVLPVYDVKPESDLESDLGINAAGFTELEQKLQVALDLEILPVAIEGAVTVADLIEKLDEILYC